MPKEVDEDAPLYFRQALLEADETWSTHEKIIDLSKKPFRSAIPPVRGAAVKLVPTLDARGRHALIV